MLKKPALLTAASLVPLVSLPLHGADLLAYYDFNDNTDPTSAVDVSGNAFDASFRHTDFPLVHGSNRSQEPELEIRQRKEGKPKVQNSARCAEPAQGD